MCSAGQGAFKVKATDVIGQERSDIRAASGIGKAAVTSYALAGARTIYATDLSESGLQEVAGGVMREHPKIKVVAVRMGIARSEEMEALVRRVVNESRRLDWFFANAGIVDFESFNNTTEEQMTRLFTVNTIGVFNSIQWAARGMMNISDEKPRSGGSIVVTSPAYTTSKHATLGLLRSAAAQLMLAKTGIRVNGVAPGPTKTSIGAHTLQSGTMSESARKAFMEKGPKVEQSMMDAVAPPEEVADVAVFLSSPLSAGINGQNILTDRGMRLAVHAFAGVFELPEFKPL
ncbi:hypothetical protein EHS25_003979 [Saitozyma podzolica]|uniref:NAD(P)-binding protein n=1 Tax=Saitozyma podzolica TaxID=1890683 RepID=A0A427YT19_9TREE|nr:hypothetical protein EHS25_003979 [Saitozyma podzolica]